MTIPYQSLPTPPDTISEAKIIARLVDGIGFRYQLATNGLSQKEIDFCPIAGSMNMICLLYTSPSPRDATLSRMPSSA